MMSFPRESIFSSALRSLFKAFGALMGVFLAILASIIAIGLLTDTVSTPSKSSLTVSADASGNRKLLASTVPVILRMDIHGVIGELGVKEDKFENMLLDSREGALANNRVKGVLLHINSPGGAATDSSAIYRLLKSYKEKYRVPIFAFVDGLCASGGMYIACSADKIFATPDSVVGSVGVRFGPAFNFSGSMDKIGMQSLTLTEGKDKDALNPFRPWKPGEEKTLQAIIAANYEQFVDTVSSARPQLSKDLLVGEYGAHVFIATEAQKLGYIDESQVDYNGALSQLVSAAGLKEDEKYQVITIEPSEGLIQQLSQNKFKIEHILSPTPEHSSELKGKLLYLYQ